MLKTITALMLIALAALFPAARADDELVQRAAASREAVKQTQAALQQELQAALKKGRTGARYPRVRRQGAGDCQGSVAEAGHDHPAHEPQAAQPLRCAG